MDNSQIAWTSKDNNDEDVASVSPEAWSKFYIFVFVFVYRIVRMTEDVYYLIEMHHNGLILGGPGMIWNLAFWLADNDFRILWEKTSYQFSAFD